jgi:hypothetical protein
MRIQPKRPSLALVGLVALAAIGVLNACGGNDATRSTATTSTAAPPTTTTTAEQSFESDLYGYSVDSWTGTSAQTAWDGTGSPGDGDPTVDSLSGPELQRAFAYAGPTKATLKAFRRQGPEDERAAARLPDRLAQVIGASTRAADEK